MAKIPPGVGPRFPQVVVLFGATGDLARRKLLTGLYHLSSVGFIPGCRVIGVSLDDMDAAAFRTFARAALDEFSNRKVTDSDWQAFAAILDYVPLSAGAAALKAAVERAEQSLGTESRRLHYLSVPPSAALAAVRLLADAGLVEHARIIMEKPFGTDLASAVKLNAQLHEVFDEDRIFRIDHYLGKETVQNLIALRFANTMFEPLWNNLTIDHVQITVAETEGVGDRWPYYDEHGALRDMLQNHMLQLLCLVAMEPPADMEPDSVRNEKVKVLKSLRPFTRAEAQASSVRGQYSKGVVLGKEAAAYETERGQASNTETFVALRADIDNWRWAGVPFYLRTGKRLPERRTQIVIQFKGVPHSIFGGAAKADLVANQLVIDLQPDEDIELVLMNKAPGISQGGMRLQSLPLSLSLLKAYSGPNARRRIAYERLILDVIHGASTLFVRRDEIEQAWAWVDGVALAWSEAGMTPKPYSAGSWGPAGAFALIERSERTWHD